MKLVEILPIENVKVPLEGKTKDEIITELVDIISFSNPLIDKNLVLKSVIDREKTMSTGIGKGIAIPHAKSKGVNEIATALGIAPDGIDFDALDSQPVYLFFLIAAPEGPAGPHLHCLSKISRLLNHDGYREKLLNSSSAKEALRLVEEGEREILK